MQQYVVTITRQFASMGRSVAKELSKELEIEFYDRLFVEEVAKRMNLSPAFISGQEEAIDKQHKHSFFPLGMGLNVQDEIFAVQTNLMQDWAKKGSCIFVGRLCDDILANHPNNISIHIYTSYENRFKNCVERLGIDEKSAKKMIADVDHARERYRKKYAPNSHDFFKNKQVMLDSSYFGIEGTARVIAGLVREKFQ